ncbi:MAG: hypothetical protein P8Y36_10900, partial [Alphaproteobacteria bacterium]
MNAKSLILRFLLAVLVLSLGIAPVVAQSDSAGQSPSAKPALRNALPVARSGQQAPQSAFQMPARSETSWWRWLLNQQRTLQRKLATALRSLKTDNAPLPAAVFLVLASFLYGVFHAAGPGHGKAVISSYVLANRATLRRGIVLSFLSGQVQALSAIAIVGVLAVAMNAAGLEIRKVVNRFEMASSLMIALAGLLLLVMYLRRRFGTPVAAPSVSTQSAGAA